LHVCDALVGLAKEYSVKCVVQIGAEDGYECNFIREQTECVAVAIDGDPKTSPCSALIRFCRGIIGGDNRMADFYINEQLGLSGKIGRGSREQHIAVEQLTLDSFCESHGLAPDMLIIDTEGTALDVLSGGANVLKGVRVIYAEVQTREIRPGVSLLPSVDAFLVGHGFECRPGLPGYMADGQGNFTWVKVSNETA
jgi:FkbM family methyltransferase